MKLDRSLSFSAFLVAGLVALSEADAAFVYSADGGGGGLRIALPRIDGISCQLGSCTESDFEAATPRSGSSSNGQRRRDADEAFRELRRELDEDAKKWRGRKLMYFGNNAGDADAREAARKWVEKSFDLASELNSDFAYSPKKRDANEKILRKYRKWAEVMYSDYGDEADEAKAEGANTETVDDLPSNKKDEEDNDGGNDDKEPLTVTPYAENASDDETFRVAVDLPGVERDDVDVSAQDDFLVVEAKRQRGGKEIKYSKKIACAESEVYVERMEATYDNGVLVISAPKKKDEAIETKRRIPIV